MQDTALIWAAELRTQANTSPLIGNIQGSLWRLYPLFVHDRLRPRGQDPFSYEGLITNCLIHMADILKALDKVGCRLIQNDYVDSRYRDLTELIIEMRNASCHAFTGKRKYKQNWFINFSVFCQKGQENNKFFFNGEYIESEYDDDYLICYGAERMYLYRNLVRAYDLIRQMAGTPALSVSYGFKSYYPFNPATNFSNR